jgi:hypothetical protein
MPVTHKVRMERFTALIKQTLRLRLRVIKVNLTTPLLAHGRPHPPPYHYKIALMKI